MTYPRRWGLAFSSIRHATFLSIIVTLILIAPIAFASPPDPSWIAGIYDGADGDDVVSLVYETSGSNAAPPSHVSPLACLMDTSFASIVQRVPGSQCTGRPRSPPIVPPLVCSISHQTTHPPTTSTSLGPVPVPQSPSSVCQQRSTSVNTLEISARVTSFPAFQVEGTTQAARKRQATLKSYVRLTPTCSDSIARWLPNARKNVDRCHFRDASL